MIELKAFSHSGKDKDNEDYALCHRLSGNSLVAVLADGMGGLSYGACAAKIISDSILATVGRCCFQCSKDTNSPTYG